MSAGFFSPREVRRDGLFYMKVYGSGVSHRKNFYIRTFGYMDKANIFGGMRSDLSEYS
jgi:hypothetical protein